VPREAEASADVSRTGTAAGFRLKGVAFILVGSALFSLHDAIVKLVSGTYPVSEVLAIRSLAGFVPLLALLYFDGGMGGLRTRRAGLHLLRASLLFVTFAAYYVALAAIPLAEAASLYYSAPLFIVALSGPVLMERVGLDRWISVVLGFVGVIIVCRPSTGNLDWAALLGVASAACYGSAQIIARKLGSTDRASVMAFYQNAINLVGACGFGLLVRGGVDADVHHASLQFLLRSWAAPGFGDLLVMASTGVLAVCGSWCLAHAYRISQANLVAPFEYAAIVMAVLWGLLIWGELPDLQAGVGMVLIVASGLYVLRPYRR
jgi:drug/metabolite transporter (DMT)-like permease